MPNPEESGSVREALHNAVEEVASQVDDRGTSPEQTTDVTPEVIAAPESWSVEDKGIFEKITDPEVRKWAVARDTGYTTKLKDFEPVQQRLQSFEKVLEPHQERLKAAGQEPAAVFDNLLKAQLVLEQKPLEGIQWLITQYGVDKQALIALLKGEQPKQPGIEGAEDLGFTEAQIKFLNERLKPVEELTQAQKDEKERQAAEVKKTTDETIKVFREELDPATKQPMRPFITDEAVSKRMAILIKTGDVPIVGGDLKSALQEAYDQACRSVASVRDKYLESLKPKVPDVSQERLLKAKRAGVGLTGHGSGSQPSRQPTGSVREQLAAGMRQQGIDI